MNMLMKVGKFGISGFKFIFCFSFYNHFFKFKANFIILSKKQTKNRDYL